VRSERLEAVFIIVVVLTILGSKYITTEES